MDCRSMCLAGGVHSGAGVTDASLRPETTSGGQEPGLWTPRHLDSNPVSTVCQHCDAG